MARTLVDLAHVLPRPALTRAVREAQYLRLFRLDRTLESLDRRPSANLRSLLAELASEGGGRSAPAETYLEDRLLEIIARHRIRRPELQRRIGTPRVDFVWPDERVVVETDGWQAHGTRDAFHRDRANTNTLQLAGFVVLRFTAAQLRDGRAVARQIKQALSRNARIA